MKRFYTVCLLLEVAFLTANAQKVLWKAADNLHHGAQGFAVGFDEENNVYTGSAYFSDSAKPSNFIKYDAAGNKLWEISYVDSTWPGQFLWGMKTTKTGSTYAFGGNNYHYFFIKISATGILEWKILTDARYLFDTTFYLASLAIDDKENIYATGGKDRQVYTAKYDSSGNLIWWQQYTTGIEDTVAGFSIDLDNEGNALVLCGTGGELLVLKYDQDGRLIWKWSYQNNTFNSVFTLIPAEIKNDRNNNINVISLLGNSLAYGVDTDFLFHISSSGNLLWKRNFSGDDELADFITDTSNNIYLIINSMPGVRITKYTPEGDSTCTQSFANHAHLFNLVYQHQNVYAGGNLYPNQFAVNLDSNLNIRWESLITPAYGVASTYEMALDHSSNVLMEG